MRKNNFNYLILTLLFLNSYTQAQDWNFKLSSKVELINWKLTNKAMKASSPVSKASVELRQASGLVSQSLTDEAGNFDLTIPSNGEFTLTINSPGQNPKKFLISTKGTSSNGNEANFRPSINIVGIIMSKYVKDMNYLGLEQSRVEIEHSVKNNNATKVIPKTSIHDGEYKLIQKFCTANKLGDMALENKNYDLAKTFYLMAADMISSESYPKDQLKKAEEGLKIEKASRKKQKTKQNKVKSAITNQKSSSPTAKNTNNKSSVESGKSTHKTRKVLGSK